MIGSLSDNPQLGAFWKAKPEFDTPANRTTLENTLRVTMQNPTNNSVKLETLTTPDMLARIFEATKSQYEANPKRPEATPTVEAANPHFEQPENPLTAATTLHEAIVIQERLAIEAKEEYQRRRCETNFGQSEGQRRMNQTFKRVKRERGNLP